MSENEKTASNGIDVDAIRARAMHSTVPDQTRSDILALLIALQSALEDASESMALVDQQGELLTRTVNVLRGDPPPLVHWSHHDVAELAQGMRDARTQAIALADMMRERAERAEATR